MKVLALELSTARGGVAWTDGKEEWKQEWPNDRKNSGEFFDTLQRLVAEKGRPNRIVVGLGPGSYAGTRIAISAAFGLAAAGRAQLIGLPSICAIETEAKEYRVIGDARRHTFFLARVRANRLIEGPVLLAEDEMRRQLSAGPDGLPVFTSDDKLPRFAEATVQYPSALVLARLALKESESFSVSPLEPMYLREPHITVPRNTAGSPH